MPVWFQVGLLVLQVINLVLVVMLTRKYRSRMDLIRQNVRDAHEDIANLRFTVDEAKFEQSLPERFRRAV